MIFSIPSTDTPNAHSPSCLLKQKIDMQHKPRILIVENEAIFVMSLERKLRICGYHVCESAFSGEEALDNLKKEKPDLIIMDLCLDSGINGIQVANKIRALSTVPIIFITGFNVVEFQEEINKIKNSTILAKPIEPDDLIETIRLSLG